MLKGMVVSIPFPGSVSFSADGSFTYTPPASPYTGAVTFTYRASDGTNPSNVATVTLHVNSPPAVANDSYSIPAGSTLTTVPGLSALVLNSQLGDSIGHGNYKTLNTGTGWFSATV